MLPDYIKENLESCNKEQLIWIVEHLSTALGEIGMICWHTDKFDYTTEEAINKIRDELKNSDLSFSIDTNRLSAFVDFKMGKITVSEYRKRLGLDD